MPELTCSACKFENACTLLGRPRKYYTECEDFEWSDTEDDDE
ncbi:MAG: hypothetical protein WC437_04995 [Patescibacteria group bacterium]